MNKRNFVYNYIPLKQDFDELQNDMEGGIKGVASAVAGMGILSGLTVNIAGSDATVSPGLAYDGQGNRMAPNDPLVVPIGGITRPSAGRYKWVTVALRYQVKELGEVIDGNNDTWPARLLDSYSALLLEGTEGTAATATKPSFLDWQVPLVDIRIDHSSPWKNLITETDRRPVLIPIAQAAAQVEAHQAQEITDDHAVHGIKQGAGNGLNADALDGKHLSEIWDMLFPVGDFYTQYPGGLTPVAKGLPGTWEAKFESEGIFFRTPGGHASAFGAGIQEDAMQRITGRFAPSGVYNWMEGSGAFRNEGLNKNRRTRGTDSGYNGGYINFNSMWSVSPSQAKTDPHETRSRNRTFRIWRRVS